MSMADESMEAYQRLVGLDSADSCAETSSRIAAGENPMRIKLELSQRIVERFHGQEEAICARDNWERIFSLRQTPGNMPVYTITSPMDISRVLKEGGLAASLSEGRRLVAEGAVYVQDVRVSDPGQVIDFGTSGFNELVIRIGRRRFLRVRL